ncbi:receptor-like protein kinase [Prosopis cineraria]|uniref:receptor-like protein kinase n=1 Tax=Prosopis cineraria TaxID=364024 RepID=UPI002410A756|nr:receptor-like protein kinase [Prosopis cineraria]
MPGGKLHDALREKNPPPSLKWKVHFTIATGIACGLAYLHLDCHPAIVHGAIKPRNILLVSDMEPHIVDFSFAQFFDQSSSTPSSSVPAVDVYDYGIVLLQLITQKKAVDPSFIEGIEIRSWVRTVLGETGEINKIVDESLAEEVLNPFVLAQVIDVLKVVLRCTEKNPYMRPTMRDIIRQLLGKTWLSYR